MVANLVVKSDAVVVGQDGWEDGEMGDGCPMRLWPSMSMMLAELEYTEALDSSTFARIPSAWREIL